MWWVGSSHQPNSTPATPSLPSSARWEWNTRKGRSLRNEFNLWSKTCTRRQSRTRDSPGQGMCSHSPGSRASAHPTSAWQHRCHEPSCSCAICVPSQALAHPDPAPLEGTGRVRNRERLGTAQAPLGSSWSSQDCVIRTVFSTNQKSSTFWAALKKMNSISARRSAEMRNGNENGIFHSSSCKEQSYSRRAALASDKTGESG